jgi:dolichyl-phosphate beta-glucosyltransferase
MTTMIVVPVFNEAIRLDLKAFYAFQKAHQDYKFVFVDDGSRDETATIIRAFIAEHKLDDDFYLLQMPINKGKAEAVRVGMLHVLSLNPTYVGYWDADLATPLTALPRFVETLALFSEVEMVTGARVKLLGRNIHRYPWRHYVGRVFATLASLTLQLGIYDTQCGAKVLRHSKLTGGLFAEPFLSRWIFDVELIARLYAATSQKWGQAIHQGSQPIYELVLDQWEDKAGSKVNLRAYVLSLLDLWRIFRTYRRFA